MYSFEDYVRWKLLNAREAKVIPPADDLPHFAGGRLIRPHELRLSPLVANAARVLRLVENHVGLQRPSAAKWSWLLGGALHDRLRLGDAWEHEGEVEITLSDAKMGEYVLRGQFDAFYKGVETEWGKWPPAVIDWKYASRSKNAPDSGDVVQVNAYRYAIKVTRGQDVLAYVVYVTPYGAEVYDVTRDDSWTLGVIWSWVREAVALLPAAVVSEAVNFAKDNMEAWPRQYRDLAYRVVSTLMRLLYQPSKILPIVVAMSRGDGNAVEALWET